MDNLKLEEKLDRIEKLLISNKKVLSLEDLSDYSGMKISYLYKLTSRFEIPFSKPQGKLIFFDKAEIDVWLLRNKHKSNDQLDQDAISHVFRSKTR